MATQLRLSLTLSGGASLGAYQAGATAALTVAVQHLLEAGDTRVRVDAMGGASAGALVAFFSAYALAEGLDPVAFLETLWVERVSLDLLRSRHSRSPLDFEALREGLRPILGADGSEPQHPATRPPQPSPIALHVSLTGLQGLTYPIRAMRREGEITAVTYTDWGQFLFRPGAGPHPLFEPEGGSPLDFVLASAANPGAFAPRLLDRSDDAAGYRTRGISDLPDHGKLWYSDGGLVQSEPLGRVVAAGRLSGESETEGAGDRGDRQERGDVRRVNIVVDPRSEGPSGSRRWTDPEQVPRWGEGLSRALAVLPAQIIYDDLRRTEKRNTRLDWADRLVEALVDRLGPDAEGALDGVLSAIDEERRALSRGGEGDGIRARERFPDDPTLRRKLRRAIEETAGLVSKERVDVDVISPRLLSEELDEDVPDLLAGEFLGDFGGFLRRELRQSDFCLGYESARIWLQRALPAAGLDDDTAAALLERVDAESPGDWREANRGKAELSSLPWRARWRLIRYALHMARVAVAGVIRG
jgi:predicted acylesterase/phospholipase RssA